ncbi:hypothetical protein WG66_011254 [Moniliophthora roreri]|nr:hypothetical protein WG66_011254 [Moniliophthora roreri]
MQIQTVQNFGWHMQPMPNEFETLPNWRANNSNESPPSPHPALVYLGHLIEPDSQPPFIPTDESPPPLQVQLPLSTQTHQAPLVMPPPMMNPSLSSTSLHQNLEVPLSMLPLSASKPLPLPIQAPRATNPIWRISTPPESRDATTVTPPPQYCSMQTESSTPISNHSELFGPTTDRPPNPLLLNQRATPMPRRALIQDPTVQSVWDDDDLVEVSSNEPSSPPTSDDDMRDEVFEYLSALYAGWLRLVTSLEIVVSNEGRDELLATTLPSAHHLLMMISTGVTLTLNSMETESSSSTTAAVENVEEQFKWVYTGRQESFQETGSRTTEREEEPSPNTPKPSDSDTLNISTDSQEELDPFQRLLQGLKNSPRSPKVQTEAMAEDKKPSGSRPRKEEPTAEEAVIGSAMPVQVVSAVKEVKATLPRAFTGTRGDAKKFLREVLIYVALNPKAFPDDRSKKLFLLSYMTDGPGEFWKNDKTDLLLAFDPDAEKVTWLEFLDDFRTSFEPLDPALKAQLDLKDLKMKERADEYTYQFTYLAKQTGYNDAAQIVAFKRGLPRSLVFKIMTRPEGAPTTIKDWMNAAIIFDEMNDQPKEDKDFLIDLMEQEGF